MRKGIAVVSYDSDVAPDARDFFIQNTAYPAIGKALVESVAKYAGPNAKIAILSSTPDATIQNAWMDAVKTYMAATYPKMTDRHHAVWPVQPVAVALCGAEHPAGVSAGDRRSSRLTARRKLVLPPRSRNSVCRARFSSRRAERSKLDPSICQGGRHQGEPALG